MTEIFGIPTQALFGQLLIGLINGSFYAMLSLGLAVIFGLLNIINFTHGAQYMMGAFARGSCSQARCRLLVGAPDNPIAVGAFASSSSARCCRVCTSSTTSTGCC
jgi:branched-chain amino acid transport system permease protein